MVASIWGRSLDDYRRAAEMLADAPAGGRRRRGQPVVPEPRGPRLDLRPRRRAVGRRDRRDGGVRSAAMGEAERQHRPDHRRRRRGRTTPVPRPSPASTRCSGSATTPTRSDRCSVPAAAGCRVGRSTPLPSEPSTTSTPRCPNCRSSASGEWRRAGMRSRCCSPVRSAVQVGTATFADPAAPLNVQRELVAWAQERGIARTTDVAALT